MKPLTRDEFRNHLRRRELAPVYVLFGTETYLRDLAVKTLADFAFGEGDFRDFNEDEFSLTSDGGLRSAIAAAEQLPMMSRRRVVRICDVRVAATALKDTLKEDDEPTLAKYLERPSESSIVIFVADELNFVRRIGKMLRDRAVTVEFAALNDQELTEWARGKFRDAECEVDARTLRQLISVVGPDVRRLTNEIDKLVTAAVPERMITSELIDTLVTNSRAIGNFQLTDQLLAGNRRQALQSMKKIFDDGGEPLMLLGLLSYNFRRLLLVKNLMERGAPRPEVAKYIKMPYDAQEEFLAMARRTETAKLTRALQRMADTDLSIKTSVGGGGPKGSRMLLEILVCELAVI